jgi:hypothetical protein
VAAVAVARGVVFEQVDVVLGSSRPVVADELVALVVVAVAPLWQSAWS